MALRFFLLKQDQIALLVQVHASFCLQQAREQTVLDRCENIVFERLNAKKIWTETECFLRILEVITSVFFNTFWLLTWQCSGVTGNVWITQIRNGSTQPPLKSNSTISTIPIILLLWSIWYSPNLDVWQLLGSVVAPCYTVSPGLPRLLLHEDKSVQLVKALPCFLPFLLSSFLLSSLISFYALFSTPPSSCHLLCPLSSLISLSSAPPPFTLPRSKNC